MCWVPVSVGEDGERSYAAPIEVKVRWETYDGEEVDAVGKTFRAKGRVFIDREVPVGTILKKPLEQKNQREGTALAALTGATGAGPHTEEDVFKQNETFKVRKRETLPLLRPGDSHWTVVLSGRND